MLTLAWCAVLCPHLHQLVAHNFLEHFLRLFEQLIEVSSAALGQNCVGRKVRQPSAADDDFSASWEGRPARLDASRRVGQTTRPSLPAVSKVLTRFCDIFPPQWPPIVLVK